MESLTQGKARKFQAYKINDKLFRRRISWNVKLDNYLELITYKASVSFGNSLSMKR